MIEIDIILAKKAILRNSGDVIENAPFDKDIPGYWFDGSSEDVMGHVDEGKDIEAYSNPKELNENDHFYDDIKNLPIYFSGKKINTMKIKIEVVHSKEMFPGLMMGKPKDGMFEKSLEGIKKLLPNYNPIINISEVKWTHLVDTDYSKGIIGHGTWGHITGVGLSITDGEDFYDFSVIFNFVPEKEKLEDAIHDAINKVDWKNLAHKWDADDF